MAEATAFDSWAVVDLLGHKRIAGRVTEVQLFGSPIARCDVPCEGGTGFTTVYFNTANIYLLTPTTEEIARAVATRNQPEPVHRYELEAPKRPRFGESMDDDEDDGF